MKSVACSLLLDYLLYSIVTQLKGSPLQWTTLYITSIKDSAMWDKPCSRYLLLARLILEGEDIMSQTRYVRFITACLTVFDLRTMLRHVFVFTVLNSYPPLGILEHQSDLDSIEYSCYESHWE
jgi:hypothetical protein